MLLFGILLVAMPLLLQKDLHALRHTCFIGFSSCVLLMIAMFYRAYQKVVSFKDLYKDNNGDPPKIKWWSDNPADVFFAFPIVILCFFASYNVLAVHSQLRHPSRRRIRNVLAISMWTCFFLFLSVGLCGYLYTIDAGVTPDNIMTAFDLDDKAILAGRVGFCMTLLFGLPLVLLPCREAIVSLPGQILFWIKDMELIDRYHHIDETYKGLLPRKVVESFNDAMESNVFKKSDLKISVSKSPHLIINGVDFDGKAPVLVSKDPEKRHGVSIVYGSIDLSTRDQNEIKEQPRPVSPSSHVDCEASSKTTDATSPFESIDPFEDDKEMGNALHAGEQVPKNELPPFPDFQKAQNPSEKSSRSWLEWWENSIVAHCAVTMCILMVTFGVAVSVPGVAVVWSIVGSSLAVWIAFVVPTACFLKIRQKKGLTSQAMCAWLLLFASLVAMVVCTRQAILNAMTSFQ